MKFSKIAHKSENKLDQMIKKFKIKIERLVDLRPTFNDFDIEITDIQKSMISEKIFGYYNLLSDLIRFRYWKYDCKCVGDLVLRYLEDFELDDLEEVKKYYFRKIKINRLKDEFK